ncbi:MAG TPA: transglycosylase domain-containing protein [Flavobacteriaceae bacterium]|nr:transglycosylase domain-containing protein [Flavobacteriaceae bacterium]
MSKTKNKKNQKKPKKRISKGKWIFFFWVVYLVGVIGVILIFFLADKGVFGVMPSFEQLENPETNLATEVISADGETIGKYYQENRTPVDYSELSEYSIRSLIATEDIRYRNHSGIDPKSTIRAFVYLGKRGGASTISQQLAKQLFHGEGSRNPVKRVLQKIKEWIIAVRLEKNYTKNEIIAMYYNIYSFSNNADGIRSAARIYFGKEPDELDIEEAAVLAGMFKNSALYNPLRNPEGVTNRRNVVLHQMAKAGYITEQEKDSLQQLKLTLDYHPESHQSGIATYFRGYLSKFLKDWAKDNPKPDGGTYNIYRDGLKIYTTLDSRIQRHAEKAVAAHIKNLQKAFDQQNVNNKTAPFRGVTQEEIERIINRDIKNSHRYKNMKLHGKSEEEILESFEEEHEMRVFAWNEERAIDTVMTPRDSIYYYKSFLNAGMMSMTPQTGEVKAWVGGIDFKHFKYDHVQQGRRQVGSTFKPYVYATAIDQLHYSPCKKFPNSPYTIPEGRYGLLEDWTPKNAGDSYGGMVTIKEALAKSLNTVTTRLIDKTGPQPVIDLLEKLQVNTDDIPAAPAIALGSVDMSVYEMVSAYSTFANKGVYIKPVVVTTITDKNGTVLYQNQPETKDVLSEESSYVIMKLLEGVTQYGSGARLRGSWAANNSFYKKIITGYPYDFKNPIAGKTGTTQNQSDGWFMGVVPNLTTGVWVGGANRSVHFSSLQYGQGATMALPIWGSYMKMLYADEELDISQDEFEEPEELNINVDCSKEDDQKDADNILDDLDDLRLN